MRARGRADLLNLLDGLPDIDAANVVRCLRVLLRRPLLRTGGPDSDLLPLVYRHRAVLQELVGALLGYRLVVERRYARLYKTGPGEDPTRSAATLNPRGYAYLALTLAALTGAGRQVLLSRLVEDIRAAAVEAGIVVGDSLPDVRALAAALRHLVGLGVIHETEGSVASLGELSAGEALITVDTDLLGHLLSAPIGSVADADELIRIAAEPGTPSPEHAVRRRLIEDPVVLYSDLPPEHAEWLRRRHRDESHVLETYVGLATETRAEGIAVTDPEEYLTDVVFPGTGTVARITMLALPEILALPDVVAPAEGTGTDTDSAEADPPARPDGRRRLPLGKLHDICADLVEAYPAAWSKQATENLDALAADVLSLLRSLGLAHQSPVDGGWLLSPAAYRWYPQPDDSPAPASAARADYGGTPGWELFDIPDPPLGAPPPAARLDPDDSSDTEEYSE